MTTKLEKAIQLLKKHHCECSGISEDDFELFVLVVSEKSDSPGLHNYTQMDGGTVYCFHDRDIFSEIRLHATSKADGEISSEED